MPANPEGFSGDIAIGAIQTDLSPYSVGQQNVGGVVRSPFLTDNNGNHFAVAPSTAMSRGLPGGLFGAPRRSGDASPTRTRITARRGASAVV